MARQVLNAAGEDVLESDLRQQKRKESTYETELLERKGGSKYLRSRWRNSNRKGKIVPCDSCIPPL